MLFQQVHTLGSMQKIKESPHSQVSPLTHFQWWWSGQAQVQHQLILNSWYSIESLVTIENDESGFSFFKILNRKVLVVLSIIFLGCHHVQTTLRNTIEMECAGVILYQFVSYPCLQIITQIIHHILGYRIWPSLAQHSITQVMISNLGYDL